MHAVFRINWIFRDDLHVCHMLEFERATWESMDCRINERVLRNGSFDGGGNRAFNESS